MAYRGQPAYMAPAYGAPPMMNGPPPGRYRGGQQPMNRPDIPSGPPVTVFMGNITERAQDAMIRHLLTTCGSVISWKRVQGATGRLQAFGFCEYANPDAAARAIRLLHDMGIADKALVVKVDSKTKDVLHEYKRQRKSKMLGESASPAPAEDGAEIKDADFVDPDMKHEDALALERVQAILQDHMQEMDNYVPPEVKKADKKKDDYQTGPKESLDDVEMEDGKRDIIHREIDKFRETMKIREKEKEDEKKKREEQDGAPPARPSEDRRPPAVITIRDTRDTRDRSHTAGPGRVRPTFSRSRSRTPTRRRSRSRDVEIIRQTQGPPRNSRSNSRRPFRRSRSRSRSRSRDRTGRDRDPKSWKEREIEEEEKEARKAERKARDKEANYQERLAKWESRETKMTKDHNRYREKEVKRRADIDKEARKLREFLEDYEDERDDEKYYKNRELDKRLLEREKEAQRDAEDRAKEKEEIEELKAQIMKEGFTDPNAELQRRMMIASAVQATETPDIIIPQACHNLDEDDIAVIEPSSNSLEASPDDFVHHDDISQHSFSQDLSQDGNPPLISVIRPPSASPQTPVSQTTPLAVPAPLEAEADPSPGAVPAPTIKQPLQVSGRKKLEVSQVFSQGDEDEGASPSKKKKPLPSLTSSRKEDGSGHKSSSGGSEDKRRHIKSIIDKIPTDKNALFEYAITWDLVDTHLMERRIQPWVSKKIAEYIGEPEPALTDFICSKVLAGSTPKAVLEDVQMVLDEEAEVFVVKLWRLLIYEIENKKHKIGGSSNKG